jgi:hypothetical protein
MPNDNKPKLDDRFIKSIKGKDFVLYAGLLDLAHQIGIQSIRIDIFQYPTEHNGMEAICKAHVESKNGEDFIEIADANPNNVAPLVRQHVLRMAATRAKARALRDMTNIGITCLEELGNIDDVDPTGLNPIGNHPKFQKPVQTQSKAQSNAQGNAGTNKPENINVGSQKKTQAPKAKEKENPKQNTSDNNSGSTEKPKMSAAQKKAILNLAQRRGLSEDDLTKLSIETFNMKFEFLDSSSASVFIRDLQQAA